MGVWYWVHWGGVEEVVQSFCRLAGDSPWAAWVLSFPASCFTRRPSYFTRFPVLLGPKEFAGGAANYKSGSPTTSSLSRARQMPGTTRRHGLQAARCPGRQRKALPRPDHPLLGPQKRSGGVKHPPHDGGGATAQAGSHQKNRREQKFASCSGLGFRILPVEAAAGRGRAGLVMKLLLEAPAGRLEAQTQRGPLLGR